VAGGFRTLRAKAPRRTSRAQGSAVTSSIPGATCPAYFSALVAAVKGPFHQHCALAARKFWKKYKTKFRGQQMVTVKRKCLLLEKLNLSNE